jgi:CHAD domain-containing protein
MSSHAYRLKTDEEVGQGLRRIAAGRAENALESLAAVGEGNLAAAIHGARKDLKKLRAVLRLIGHELGRKTFEAERRRYREAGRLLAGSRDAEVKLATLSTLRKQFQDLPAATALRWEQVLERERDEVGAEDGERAEAVRLIERGREGIAGWDLPAGDWRLLGPGLARAYRDGRRAMRRALADPGADDLHRWRKRAKDLWYGLRIVREAWPALLDPTVEQVHELTELLGDHHDLALLAEDLRGRDGLGEREPFAAAIAARQAELLDAATALGRRVYAEKPKAFRRRFEGYWSAWREP